MSSFKFNNLKHQKFNEMQEIINLCPDFLSMGVI